MNEQFDNQKNEIWKVKLKKEFPNHYNNYNDNDYSKIYRFCKRMEKMSKLFGEVPVIQEEYFHFILKNIDKDNFNKMINYLNKKCNILGTSYYNYEEAYDEDNYIFDMFALNYTFDENDNKECQIIMKSEYYNVQVRKFFKIMKEKNLDQILKDNIYKKSIYWCNGKSISYNYNHYFLEFYNIVDDVRYWFQDMFDNYSDLDYLSLYVLEYKDYLLLTSKEELDLSRIKKKMTEAMNDKNIIDTTFLKTKVIHKHIVNVKYNTQGGIIDKKLFK